MKNVGTPLSTGEGWSVLLLGLLTMAQQQGWIPPQVEVQALAASGALIVTTLVFVFRKAFRKGSTPFIADGHSVQIVPDMKSPDGDRPAAS